MSTEELADADPIGRIVAWLLAHPDVTAELGGPDRVSSDNEGPYPHLQISDAGGDWRDLRWLVATDVQLEMLADLDGTPDRGTLKQHMAVACAAVKEIAELPPPPGEPTITDVQAQAARGWVPLASGQGRYVSVLRVWSHP